MNLTAIVDLLNQIPDILAPVPDIIIAVVGIVMLLAGCALAIGIVSAVKKMIEDGLDFKSMWKRPLFIFIMNFINEIDLIFNATQTELNLFYQDIPNYAIYGFITVMIWLLALFLVYMKKYFIRS